jgi:REP element-mobilizing transposase RayT
MAQSLSKIIVHITFSTKNRQTFLNKAIRPKLYAYLTGILKKCESESILIGGVSDHIHILCTLSKNYSVSKVIEIIKKSSSRWLKEQSKMLSKFQWQGGYAVFSVSQSKVDETKEYIANQEEHHRKVSFSEELKGFLKKYKVDYKDEYLLD